MLSAPDSAQYPNDWAYLLSLTHHLPALLACPACLPLQEEGEYDDEA